MHQYEHQNEKKKKKKKHISLPLWSVSRSSLYIFDTFHVPYLNDFVLSLDLSNLLVPVIFTKFMEMEELVVGSTVLHDKICQTLWKKKIRDHALSSNSQERRVWDREMKQKRGLLENPAGHEENGYPLFPETEDLCGRCSFWRTRPI